MMRNLWQQSSNEHLPEGKDGIQHAKDKVMQ